jgi:argininosuccinate lyase
MDAVSDRDFVAEALFVLALVGVHLSRLGEEIVLFTTTEFGFASLGDAFTTGSSMLPHKKNSDIAELARGKSGRVVGNLTSLLVTLKGLPLSYNRDLQEDKEPLFDSLRTSLLVLRALAGAVSSMTWHVDVTGAAASDELLTAIDLAERLVARGVPFRVAHERVGRLVGESVTSHRSLASLVAVDPELSEFSYLFEPGETLRQRVSPGASGPKVANTQRDRLTAQRQSLRSRFVQ